MREYEQEWERVSVTSEWVHIHENRICIHVYTSILYVSTHNSTARQQIEMTENWTCILYNETTVITTITATTADYESKICPIHWRQQTSLYVLHECVWVQRGNMWREKWSAQFSCASIFISHRSKWKIVCSTPNICMNEPLPLLNYNYIVLCVQYLCLYQFPIAWTRV